MKRWCNHDMQNKWNNTLDVTTYVLYSCPHNVNEYLVMTRSSQNKKLHLLKLIVSEMFYSFLPECVNRTQNRYGHFGYYLSNECSRKHVFGTLERLKQINQGWAGISNLQVFSLTHALLTICKTNGAIC